MADIGDIALSDGCAEEDERPSGRRRGRGRHRRRSAVACAVVASGIVLVAVSPIGTAGAATAPSGSSAAKASGGGFQSLQKALEARLAARQHRLARLTHDVTSARHLTDSDRSVLESNLATETAGIDALAAKVPNDTTIAQLAADHKAMMSCRVFVVMSPQVYSTIRADVQTAVEQRVQTAEPRIEALIQHAQSQGKNVQGAQDAYADLVIQVSNAENDTSGVAAAVLATSPAAWPSNKTIFTNAKSSLHQASGALQSARSDVETIFKDLGR